MNKLVSIVIPTISSREKTFERAVKSVTKQTYQNIEIIPIRDIKNSAKARNIGIQKSNGNYIAFLDDDDVWLPTKLEKQLTLFDDKTKLVGCWIDDRRFYKPYILKCKEKLCLKELLQQFNFLSTSAYVFDAAFLKGYLFDTTFPSAQEYELAIRACMAYPVKCYQEALVIQNRSEHQITKDWKKKKLGLKLLLKKYKQLYMDYG